MGTTGSSPAQAAPAVNSLPPPEEQVSEAPKKRAKCPMCVCKAERQLRDVCMVENGQESCGEAIATLNACLVNEGFTEFAKKH